MKKLIEECQKMVVFVGRKPIEAIVLQLILGVDYKVVFRPNVTEALRLLIHSKETSHMLTIFECYLTQAENNSFINIIKTRLDAKLIAYFPFVRDEKELDHCLNNGADKILIGNILKEDYLKAVIESAWTGRN